MMDENLRVALVQFLNSNGKAPDPASGLKVELYGFESTLDVWYVDSHDKYEVLEMRNPGIHSLLQFLLEYQVT